MFHQSYILPPLSFLCAAPNISVVPPVTSILPTDTEVTLQCLNVGGNPSVPIIWISPLSSIQALGTEPTLTLDLSVGGDLMDGMVIYCAVRDPESNDPNPEGILAYSGTVIRHIQGKQLYACTYAASYPNSGQSKKVYGGVPILMWSLLRQRKR